MHKIFAFSLGILFNFAAQAETMSCLIGVYKASDMYEGADAEQSTAIVRVPLTELGGGVEVKINQQNVAVDLVKRQHTDLYDISVLLLTPEDDRIKGREFVTLFSDYLINEGPATNNGWTVDYKPGAISYAYLQRSVGTMALTGKMREALKASGRWGQYPFTSSLLDVTQSNIVAEAVQDLIAENQLKKSDIIAISSLLSCTKN
jgi:hypothetical protein